MRSFVVAILLSASLYTGIAAAEPYRLGPGDRLRIEVFNQPTLTREALLQADGSAQLPRIGSVPLDGLTLAEARDLLVERLISALGLSEPDVTVEIAAYRPIYLTGGVESPGAYAYVPGMTVMHAVTMAGGYRRAQPGDAAAWLETGRLSERLEQLRDQLAISHMRLARLEAERDGTADPGLTPNLAGLVSSARASELRAHEVSTMGERTASFDGALRIFDQRREQLNNEIAALEAQRAAKIEQVAVLRREAGSIKDLLAKGLTPASRGFELDRTIIGAEADRRQIEAFIARNRGEIVGVDQAELNMRSQRRLDVVTGIKDARDEVAQQQAALAAIEEQIDVARGLSRGLEMVPERSGLQFDQPMVMRRGADRFTPIGLTDKVQPDDLLAIPQKPVRGLD